MVAPNFPFNFWHRHFFAILLFPPRFTGQDRAKNCRFRLFWEIGRDEKLEVVPWEDVPADPLLLARKGGDLCQYSDAYWVLSQLISVSELFMTERSGPAQQGEARMRITPASTKIASADVLPRLDHGHIAAIPRGSREDYRASRRPLLRHLIERSLKKAIISARWMAEQRDDNIKERAITAMSNPSNQESGSWLESRGFGALDWASEKHSVVVVDPQGNVLEDFEIEHSALGWKKFRERMRPYGSIPFAIETSQGAAVEQLLEAGMHVYPLNPKSAQAYRERKAPSGVKDDQLDAWSFADALRVDGQNWKPLRPEGSVIKELRLLCRDEIVLIEQRTAFINQLRHALAEYYPTALEAFEDWGAMSAWMFLQRFPTPQLLEKAGKRQWEKFLHTRHLWRNESGPRRMELFAKATEFCGSEPTANAKSMLALSLVKMLFARQSTR